MQGGIRLVVFDAVGTLMTPTPAVADVYRQIGHKYGCDRSREDISARFRQVFRDTEAGSPDDPNRWGTSEARERERWRTIVDHVLGDTRDPDACFEELWNHFAAPASWTCFADVEPCLIALRQLEIQVAIASNFDARLHTVCQAHPVLQQIPLRVVSSEAGSRKPAAEFYATVEQLGGYAAANILMIGDDEIADVAAPRSCGWSALHLNRSVRLQRSPGQDPTQYPDPILLREDSLPAANGSLTSLEELVPWLQTHNLA